MNRSTRTTAQNSTRRTTRTNPRSPKRTPRKTPRESNKKITIKINSPPMRVFCLIAHPEPNRRSFCHAVYRKTIETLRLNNHEVMTSDLYDCNFTQLPTLDDFDEPDPNLSYQDHQKRGLYNEEILRYQSRIEWCTHLLLFTPLHWLSPSAALMSFWEKVFGEGWAFTESQSYTKGFMAGKKAMVIVTVGQEQMYYGKDSLNISIEELMYPLTFRCFAKCGFTPLRTQAFFGLYTADAQKRIDMLNAWGEHVLDLWSRESIKFEISGNNQTDTKNNREILAELGDYPLMKPKEPIFF
ncbi:NAD(P)H-dependent oxidoreductase [Histomonas meleagridis]|uniref:NAD(P)H-dependent oxidoreductase n=1 Tax=Histomonas meleagridis TaxID=135588 RepID=UPI00355A18D2|nr:NAD(P)H-dependent oxidoreductase [Histomonas meleagridis]KAH0796983.1 NAD(P)H-dependent oxidoreductase [Histomonas meleagridis]